MRGVPKQPLNISIVGSIVENKLKSLKKQRFFFGSCLSYSTIKHPEYDIANQELYWSKMCVYWNHKCCTCA